MKAESKLLLNERLLNVIPELAVAVGLNNAIVLQQIQYWIWINRRAEKNFRDGYHWTYNSYKEWQKQFPFWSVATVQRIFMELEADNLIISGVFNRTILDRTKWYRINYDALDERIEENHDRYEKMVDSDYSKLIQSRLPQNDEMQDINLTSPIPESNHILASDKIEEIWVSVLELLKEEVSPPNFRTWLKDTVPLTFDGETFVVGVKNSFVAEYLHKNQRSIIERNLCRVLGRSGVFFECLVSPVKGSKGNEKTENRRPRR